MALNCFLHLLHCLKEPSFVKEIELRSEQKIQMGENLVSKPLLLIYVLNDSKRYASGIDVCRRLLLNIFGLLILIF